MSGTRVAEICQRLLAPFTGDARAQWIVGRGYAIAYLVYFQLSVQYAKALLGLLWIALTPALFLAVYLPVLTYVFKATLPDAQSPLDYPLFMVAGFLVWGAFSEGFMQGAASIAYNPGVIQNAPTPPELLPLVKVTAAFVGFLITIVLFLIVLVAVGHFPGIRLVLVPVAFVLLYAFTLGLAWFFSSLAVYLRDILQLLPTLLLIEFFACPIVYSPHLATGKMALAIKVNPLSPFLALFRAGLAPSSKVAAFAWEDLALAAVWATAALLLGSVTFRKLKDGFGDAL